VCEFLQSLITLTFIGTAFVQRDGQNFEPLQRQTKYKPSQVMSLQGRLLVFSG
jgi:hypothetical protein